MRQRTVRTIQTWLSAGLFLLITHSYLSAATPADFSTSFEQANRLYERGDYSEAARLYEILVRSGRTSAALHFNLANAYFKVGQIGKALFHYRIAESIAPRDPDIQANLRFTRNSVPDSSSISPSLVDRILCYFTLDELAMVSALLLWIWVALVCLIIFRPSLTPKLRGVGLLVGSLLAGTVILLIAAILSSRSQTVIVDSSTKATIHLGPLTESQPSFTAADGSELQLLAQREDWLQVRDRLNRSGWIARTNALLFPPRPSF
jgi:tetratricopeptide (TPR) repeat protein